METQRDSGEREREKERERERGRERERERERIDEQWVAASCQIEK